MAFFGKPARARRAATIGKPVNLGVEALESRLTPYALSGNAWIKPELITISFVPDGTILGTDSSGPITSNLQASFNAKFGNAANWQNQILKAAQQWAAQTNINFKVVSDNGAEIGSGSYQQGDANFGDIRIGGYNFGTTTLAQAYMPPPDNGDSFAGDFQFNTGQVWNVGSTYDLYTVAMHEFGHALGLYHGNSGSAMYGSYGGILATVQPDDINGIRAVTSWSENGFSSPGYGGARTHDTYDAAAANGSFTTASTITSTISTTTKTALLSNLNITSTSDVDYYKFVVPTGLGGTLNVKVQSSGLSLLAPSLTLYNGSQGEMVTQSASSTDYDGTTLSFTASVTAGQTYYVKVSGLNTTAFGTGRYALALGFAGVTAPTAASPNTQTANDPNSMGGGGQAVGLGPETRVNTTTANEQLISYYGSRAVALDQSGNYVVVWESYGQANASWDVYGQRFDMNGIKIGSEFRVNTYTRKDQNWAAIAMAPNGAFVVTWRSVGQDGSGDGIYAQRFDAAGVKQGSEFRVNVTTSGDQYLAQVAMDANGNFVIAWMGNDASGLGIFARRYDAAGTALGSEFRVNTTITNDQGGPAIGMNDSGAFVIAWDQRTADWSDSEIHAQRYDAQGNTLGSEFRVNTTLTGIQEEAAVGVDSQGNFVITWQGPDAGGKGIFGQRFNAAGTAQGSEFGINTYSTDDQVHGRVSMSAGGNFFVTWKSWWQDGDQFGVYAQQFKANGTPQGSEFRVNSTTSGTQHYSSMGLNANGQAVLVWAGNGPGDDAGIFSQRFMVSYGGLNPMQASEPHGYNPDGCLEHDHSHDHASDEGDGGTSVGSAGENPSGSLPTSTVDRNFLFGLITRRRDEGTPRREQDPIRSRSNEANPQETRVSTMGRRTETPLQANTRRKAGSTTTISDPIPKGV